MVNFVIVAAIVVTILTGIPVFLQLRRHPKGLIVCFFVEMWERFSFYGMRGLLIYYLTKHFLFTDVEASRQYASFMTLIYLIPLIGGIVADRWLGTRRAIIFGGILLVLGHVGMAVEGQPAQQSLTHLGHTYAFVRQDDGTSKLKVGQGLYAYATDSGKGLVIDGLPKDSPLPSRLPAGSFTTGKINPTPWGETAFFVSVSLIIMGVGFLKPNVSTIVGQLYGGLDPRRESGFQLYYFGINLGSFWAAVVCGWLGQTVGWWAGFGVAGIGMMLGLLGFLWGKPWLQNRGEAPDVAALGRRIAGALKTEWLIYLLALLGVAVVFVLVQQNGVVLWVLVGLTLAMLGYVFYNMATRFSRGESLRISLALLLSVASIAFFTLEELAGSALSLFADRNVDLNIFARPVVWHLPGTDLVLATRAQLTAAHLPEPFLWVDTTLTAAQTQTINTGFILIFAPFFAFLFSYLGSRNANPDPVKKFAFGIVSTGIGFLALVWAAPLHNALFQLPLVFLALNYMFTTIGELTVSPVGLSQQTQLAPASVASTLMALWFTGTAWAQFFGGKITEHLSVLTLVGTVVDPAQALRQTLSVFNAIGLAAIVFGIGLFGVSFLVRKWAGSGTSAAG